MLWSNDTFESQLWKIMRIAIISIQWLWSNILLNLALRLITSSTLLQRLNDTLSAFKIDLLISTFTFELTTHVVKSLRHVWRAQSRFMNHAKTRGVKVHIDIITVFKIAIWKVKSLYIVLCYWYKKSSFIIFPWEWNAFYTKLLLP